MDLLRRMLADQEVARAEQLAVGACAAMADAQARAAEAALTVSRE